MKKKILIVSVAVVAILAIFGFMAYFLTDKYVMEMEFEKEISVVDSIVQQEEEMYQIEIPKDGSYLFHAKWETNPEGFITGCQIISESGEVVFWSTADWCDMYSNPIEMKKGTYTVAFFFITNDEQWDSFFKEAKVEDELWNVPPDLNYDFVSDGTFTAHYEFDLKEEKPIRGVAVVCGMLMGCILIVIMVALAQKGEGIKAKYDERQELVRGRGFKYAFFSMLILNIVFFGLGAAEVTIPMDAGIASMLSALLGACVYASYCVWNDGYFALNQRLGMVMIFLIIMGILNLVLGINAFVEGRAWYNGELTFHSINLFCAIIMLVIFGTMLLKKIVRDGKEE
ncbi:MAG: hypothetical protein IJ282_03030 [Lachnospiraceae bacterium]|nr:hypothetical protein [Lachnospiraceae bacterium]